MTDQRLDQLSGQVYNHILSLLDGEADGASRIAARVESAFRNAVTSGESMSCPDCGDESIDGGLCGDCEWQLDGQPTEMDEWESFDPDC